MTDSNHSSVDFKGEKIDVGNDVVGRDKIVHVVQSSAPAEPIHNSLPNQPYFFGRAAELARIADALDPDAQGWGVLISGPGGIGKTALSIRAAHLAPKETYPIKIFLSAKVTQLTPQGVEKLEDFMLPNYIALLSELACELGDDAIAKMDPNLRANEVRRLLADKHALLVIDNLETFDEKTERPRVFQFLSRLPRSCKAIVTSRRRLDTPAEIIRLDKLERDDALKLMARIAERNRFMAKTTEAERIELYEMTRGNPLLIEWLAGQLGNPKSQCRTIADACRFMETAPKDNDPLEFVFGDLLDTFTEHETAVLAALTYFTQPAKVKWIAEIAQITMTQAETALDDLADRSVLVVENNQYLLPPLTATFVRHVRPEVVAKAGEILSNLIFTLVQEKGHDQYEQFSTLEDDWPAIVAAFPLFMQGDDVNFQQLYNALDSFLIFTGRWDERLSLSLRAEDKATLSEDMHNAGWAAYRAARVYNLRGQVNELLECAKRIEKYWANAGPLEQYRVIKIRATGYKAIGDIPAAIATYQEELKIAQKYYPESNEVASAVSSIARLEHEVGNYIAAEHGYYEALEIYQKSNKQPELLICTSNLAKLAVDRGQWFQAEQTARETILIAMQIGRQDVIAECSCTLAKALTRQGRKAEGVPYAQRAVAIYTKLRSRHLANAQAVLKECEDASD